MIFTLKHKEKNTAARAGTLKTKHGLIKTPIFMPVGTRAAVKTLTPAALHQLNAQIILGNTYHLLIRPGPEIISKAGGLHKFMAWDKPILTDSGGFQVYSLGDLRKITDKGVEFRSHIDGAKHFIGPKESMEIQQMLGSDIAMVFDECPPSMAEKNKIEKAVNRTIEWAKICYDLNAEFNQRGNNQLLFGIVQGGIIDSLRLQCIENLTKIPFAGFAIGGLAVGEIQQEMYRITKLCCENLPENKPRYLMGVGKPEDIIEAVKRGVDMFDCVIPTRNARNGSAFTNKGPLQIKAGRYKEDFSPIQDDCSCYTCRHFSKAYVRHLLNVGESLGGQLLTIHNIHYYLTLMQDIRKAIIEDKFLDFVENFYQNYK